MPTQTAIALVIPVDTAPLTKTIRTDNLTDLHRLIGGSLEGVSRDGWHAYVHAEGKLIGLPVNPVATMLLFPAYTDIICGTAVLLGDNHAGDETDIPTRLAELAAALWAYGVHAG